MRVLDEKAHRIASYNKGCKCDSCIEACRNKTYNYRRRKRIADPVAYPHPCRHGCGDRFMTRNARAHHEEARHGYVMPG